jgi:hypothetical protein
VGRKAAEKIQIKTEGKSWHGKPLSTTSLSSYFHPGFTIYVFPFSRKAIVFLYWGA